MSFHAIIINVSASQNDCFIAAPFAEEFKGIREAVAQAVVRLGMRPRWVKTGEMQVSGDFVQDIITEMHAARIVIAVCTPDKTGLPNPNVMYEVGRAHALGKATLLLAIEPDKLPANIKTKHALSYQPASVGSEESINRIQLAVTNHLSMFNEGIRLTDHFATILLFVKKISEQIQLLNTIALDRLSKVAEDMTNNPDFTKIKTFRDSWTDYENFFQSITQPSIFDSLADDYRKVDDAFQSLFPASLAAAASNRAKLAAAYDIIKTRLNSYPSLHETARNDVQAMPPPGAAPSSEVLNNLYVRIRNLSKTTTPISTNASNLSGMLIETIFRTGDRHD